MGIVIKKYCPEFIKYLINDNKFHNSHKTADQFLNFTIVTSYQFSIFSGIFLTFSGKYLEFITVTLII